MAQTQKKTQPGDEYARRAKALTSAVQRLRGWIGSDPSRLPELVDALNLLTAHRLLGHAYAAAAPDAQDAVKRSAEVLRALGPIGPYTSAEDVVRCGTALVHLAAVQVAVRLPEAAGVTVESWEALRAQVAELPIDPRLEPVTVVWALSSSARTALAAGDVPLANAYADAALTRLAEAGLRADPDAAYLALDTDRLASDTRWAGGRTEESLGFLHAAKDGYDRVVDGRLAEPGRHPAGLVERLTEPLFGLYRDLADRLLAVGETDLALVTRHDLVATLRGLAARVGDPVRLQLAAALTDLVGDLLRVDRVVEAEAAADEAVDLTRAGWAVGSPRLLAAVARTRVQTATGRAEDAVAGLPPVLVA
ncbi:MAG: hypothetical protein JWP61_530, partial [Friedmanniella sp.]|nr:hypothetical protein [Friedmanniella sp.]